MKTIDPVVTEIIQNRLMEVGHEAGIALQRAAASPVVVGAKDFGFNVADHLGRSIVYSLWMPRHGTTLSYMLKSCFHRIGERNIFPGDMFLVNDPHEGALHLPDLAVISPVHYETELVGYTGCATHHLDIGAMRPGFVADATDWYQEGIHIKPIKLMERGELRQDIFDLIMDNVRMPHYQALDLKAQIAANMVAKERILELVKKYGIDTIKACYDEIIDLSEIKTRERIRMLPDGQYDATEYLDYDRLYTLRCKLIVKDDTLTFDFTGTDSQSPTYINSALPCTVANVHNIFVCMLIPDVVANEGCFRPVSVCLPEKTVLSCKPPAPSSGASTIGGWKAQILAIKTLSKALANSPESWRATASWGSGLVNPNYYGMNRDGRPFVMVDMNGCGQGGGARTTKDGFDVSNIAGSTNSSVPNIEDIEGAYPILYLDRHMVTDSGGPGKYRGGVSISFSNVPYEISKVQASLGYVGKTVPAEGIDGGKPGVTSEIRMKRNSNIKDLLKHKVPSYEEVSGEEEVFAQTAGWAIQTDGDVLYFRVQGGGGYGNPLQREAALVYKDVVEGYVSLEKAESEYGVVISKDSLRLDLEATEKLRHRMREEQKGGQGQ